jgi:hypothetical protein
MTGCSPVRIAAPRQRRRDAAILAGIGVSHLCVFALLWRAAPPPRPRAATPGLEIVRIDAAAVSPAGVQVEPAAAASASPARRSAPRGAPGPRAATGAPALPPGPSSAAGTPAAPIDWFAERDRVARDAATASAAPSPRGFGFPQQPSDGTAAPNAEFGWSHSHTHRVETMPGGGIVINLTDQCALVLFPLPFVGCALGKKPANGELFRQMHGKAHDGDWHDAAPLQVP